MIEFEVRSSILALCDSSILVYFLCVLLLSRSNQAILVLVLYKKPIAIMFSNINEQTPLRRAYICPQFIVAVLGLLPNETKKLERQIR